MSDTPIIFLPISTGKQLAQFSVGPTIATVEWTYFLIDDIDEGNPIPITERAAVHLMIGRIKASMKRAVDNTVVITDLIPKFTENRVAVKRATLLRNISLMSKLLMQKITDNSELFFGLSDLKPKEMALIADLIQALEEAGPIIDKIEIDPDKRVLKDRK